MFNYKNKIRIYIFILMWIMYLILHVFAVCYALPDIAFGVVLTHSIIRSLLLFFLLYLLNAFFTYGHLDILPDFQRIINLTAICSLVIICWLGFGYIIDLIVLGKDRSSSFLNINPFYGIISILLFLIVLNISKSKITNIEECEEETIVPEKLNDNNSTTTNINEKDPESLERIAVKQGTKINIILIDDILYLQADGDYVQIHSNIGKFLKEQTMKYFQEHLPSSKFVRVHRSTIVNVEKIARIELFEKQQQLLIMKNGDSIKVSITGSRMLKEILAL